MPAYVFRCPEGHVTEIVQSIHDGIPETVACDWRDPCAGEPCDHFEHDGDAPHDATCFHDAARVFLPPAAIHFNGRGFYATDVQGAQERRRRPNPGDDLPVPHDPAAAAIARSL